MRALTAQLDAALQAEHTAAVVLVALYFSTPVYVHSGVGDLSYNGNLYKGVGQLGRIETIEESVELKAGGVTLTLSGVPNDLVAVALTETYQNAVCKIFIAALDANHQLVPDPEIIHAGRVDDMAIAVGKQGTITLRTRDKLTDWDRPRVERYNHADQQAKVPGDKGLEYTEAMVDRTLTWGQIRV